MRSFLIFVYFFSAVYASDIAVVTIAAGTEYRKVVSPGIENKRRYCELHGYDFIVCEDVLDPSRQPSWSKVLLLAKLMENSSCKWLFWTDADSLIMNHAFRLEELIDERYNMVITVDFASICAGEFFLKNCDWSKEFLKIIYGHTECIDHRWWEQCAMIEELKTNPSHYAFIKRLPQRIMNSFPLEVFPWTGLKEIYQPGDFIFHFAGSNLELLNKLMQKYSQETMNDLTLFTLDYYLGIYGFSFSQNSGNNESYITNLQKEQCVERLKTYPSIQRVLEIGLNGGHSADMFFLSCTDLKKFVSFDINAHSYVKPATEYFSRKYKDRFSFVEGDSYTEIPKYSQANPAEKFDLIYVDGSHAYQNVLADIVNTRNLAHGNTVLWINNFRSAAVQQAVHECANKNMIEILHIHESNDPAGVRCWVEAQYN